MSNLNESIRHLEMPDRIARLPINASGFPIPWFAARLHSGEAIIRIIDPVKRLRAARLGLCWCCGEPTGSHLSFCLGPMCVVTRVSSEPPSHKSCALFACRACPYLTNPNMKRNPIIPEAGKEPPPGIMIDRNPGVAVVWTTRDFRSFRDRDNRILFSIGDPEEVLFFREGRLATSEEVWQSVESGLPCLRELAERDGKEAVASLEKYITEAMRFFPPKEPSHGK